MDERKGKLLKKLLTMSKAQEAKLKEELEASQDNTP